MSKAYTKATGTQNINPDRVLQIDHAEGIKKDPFNNLRLLDYRTNLAQGQMHPFKNCKHQANPRSKKERSA